MALLASLPERASASSQASGACYTSLHTPRHEVTFVPREGISLSPPPASYFNAISRQHDARNCTAAALAGDDRLSSHDRGDDTAPIIDAAH